MDSGTAKKSRQRGIALTAILLVVTLTVIFAEVMVRLAATPRRFPPPPRSRIQEPTEPNPHLFYCRPFLYSHIPNTRYLQQRSCFSVEYRINSRGFRGPDIPVPAVGHRRLLVIGDSIIEGHGCPFEHTIPEVLNGLLEGDGWEAVNVGVQGASPAYYALNIDRYLALLPDAVVVVLYENDLLGDRTYEQKYDSLPLLDYPDELVEGRTGTGWRGSATLCILRRGLRLAVADRGGRLLRACRNRARAAGLEPGSTAQDTLPRLKEHWSISSVYLDHLTRRFKDRGVKVFVTTLIVPVQEGRRQRLQKRLEALATAWASGSDTDYLQLSPHFASALTRHNYFDLVIKGDGHLTAEGHAVAARGLANRLTGQRLLSGPDPGQKRVKTP